MGPSRWRALPRALRAQATARWALGVAGVGVLVAGACVSTTTERPPLPWGTPLDVPAPSASAAPPSLPPLATRSLEDFVPLVALPGFEPVAAALEAGQPQRAVAELTRAMSHLPPAPVDVARFQYLLGLLRERAGELAGARVSYELAAAEDWALAPYARAGAARVALRAGDPRRAQAWLQQLPEVQPLEVEVRALRLEAARLLGERQQAIRYASPPYEPASKAERATLELGLAEVLSSPEPGASAEVVEGELLRALELARGVRVRQPAGSALYGRAQRLERQALSRLTPAAQAQWRELSPAQRLLEAETRLEAGLTSVVRETTEALLAQLPPAERWQELGCAAALLQARALAAEKAAGAAADVLTQPIQRCERWSEHPRLLFLGARYAAQDGRHALAVERYAQLERLHPQSTLADDARWHAAMSYWELRVEARFTELLSRLPEDYPEGDMALEGVFRLALRRLEKRDWRGAAAVLSRVQELATRRDPRRSAEYAGRERYFLARALLHLGEQEAACRYFEELIEQLPLSYYMLSAFTRLSALDAERAARALDRARARSSGQPFIQATAEELGAPAFLRAMELLRVGELEAARRELETLGVHAGGAAPQLLWAAATLYARAGVARWSSALARGLLVALPAAWPEGDWAQVWRLSFPRPYHEIVAREAKATGLDEALVYAVMREESVFDPRAVSPAKAIGLMQLIVPTAALYGKRAGLPHDARALERPAVNIALGCRALAALSSRFADDPWLAIPGYNAGPGRPARWRRERPAEDLDLWVELIPFIETRRYTKRVLASRAAYAVLYGEVEPMRALELPLKLSSAARQGQR